MDNIIRLLLFYEKRLVMKIIISQCIYFFKFLWVEMVLAFLFLLGSDLHSILKNLVAISFNLLPEPMVEEIEIVVNLFRTGEVVEHGDAS